MALLLRFVAHLPLPLLHVLGALLGWAVYLGSPRYRRYLRENLRSARLDNARLRRAAIAEGGKAVLEVPAIWLRPHRSVAALVVEVSGWEHIDAGAKLGRGLILLTPHLGCWEVAGQYISSRIPLTVMYSPPKLKALEPHMVAGRSREMLKSVPADLRGVRALLKALKRGEAIGMLPDQVPGVGEGEWVEFFGRPAYTMVLVSRLAEQTGAPVLLVCAERLAKGRGYRFVVEPMLPTRPPESPVRALNRSLENLIRRRPEQYLWSYNRYKAPSGAPPRPENDPPR
jgi:Kdo2-lipid IVA lauroyltransferase/acyltransferase